MDLKVSDEDAARIADHLDMASDEFIGTYLTADYDGDHKFGQTPCPFLGDDDRCTIYDLRPKDCREYPHTDKKGFTFRTMGHANNALTCPVVFWIVEEMRKRSVRRRKRKRRRR